MLHHWAIVVSWCRSMHIHTVEIFVASKIGVVSDKDKVAPTKTFSLPTS